jgi:hypothetical protein
MTEPAAAPPPDGKFLDPKANARSCLGCVAGIVLLVVLAFAIGLANAS